jgi:magnesium chelatase subunit ChlD-like protein
VLRAEADSHSSGPIAWLPTLLAKGARPLQPQHLRRRPRAAQPVRLHLIVLDVSGSMRQRGRLALAKGHAMLLIQEAARSGDDVGLLCFGGQGVDLLLPPGRARSAGSARVARVGGGGGTPLTQALAQAEGLLRRAARGNGAGESWLWLLTDGRTLEQPAQPTVPQHVVIVDFDERSRPIGRCASWAARWGAEHRFASQPCAACPTTP